MFRFKGHSFTVWKVLNITSRNTYERTFPYALHMKYLETMHTWKYNKFDELQSDISFLKRHVPYEGIFKLNVKECKGNGNGKPSI